MRDAWVMIFHLSVAWIWRSDLQICYKLSRLRSPCWSISSTARSPSFERHWFLRWLLSAHGRADQWGQSRRDPVFSADAFNRLWHTRIRAFLLCLNVTSEWFMFKHSHLVLRWCLKSSLVFAMEPESWTRRSSFSLPVVCFSTEQMSHCGNLRDGWLWKL